ncbi:MAG: hypothetical protein EPN97_14075 [Alphaproteobacteria bacterium]|nr:MAG: hypothetical protein EPN97_14075 [Alphaproteobacteria bacterium]
MSTLPAFLENCRDICDKSAHVSIDHEKLAALAATFKQASKPPSWNNYISAEAKADPLDMTRVFFEMALICAQQGGFIYPDADGRPQKWNVNGSGAQAMLNKMDELRQNGLIAGMDILAPADVRGAVTPYLDKVPSAEERIAMFEEFADPAVYKKLDALVKAAWDEDKLRYNFDFTFINKVADIFPQSFAADPFRKKAILSVLMTAAHAENRGVTVATDAPVASDYVLPQVLEGLGVLKFSDALREKLVNRQGFAENDPLVRDIRAATITACHELSQKSGARAQDIDSHLWLAGRDPAVKPKLLPTMNVYTTWF